MPFVLSAAEQRDTFAQRLRPFLSGGNALFFTGPTSGYLEPQRAIPVLTRTRLEGGTFAGIATTYAFTASRHVGVDPREIVLLAWESGHAVIAR